MNKFVILALVALSCVAGQVRAGPFGLEPGMVDDQYSEAIIPSDSEEAAYLKPEHKVFTSFCVQARDDVKSFLTSQANQAAAGLFTAFFKSAGETGNELLNIQQKSVEEAAEAIRQSVPVNQPAPETAEEAHEALTQNAEKVSLISSVSAGAKYVLSTVIDAARTELAARIALVRKQFDGENFKEKLEDLCDSVSTGLKKDLGRKLNEFKAQAKGSAASLPNAAEATAAIQTATIDNLGCLTTGRINKVAQVCNLIRVAGPALFPILGIS